MNFAEVRFWQLAFLALAVCLLGRLCVAACRREALPVYDKLGLLGLGLFLLASVSWLTFVIFLAVALGTYYGMAWVLTRPERLRRRYLWLFIPAQLSALLYYKYADFVCNGVLRLDFASLHGLIIPAGISFYTFQKIAFVLDTLVLNQRLPKLLDYLNFAAFFPQIVAGPIERRHDLQPQMDTFRFRWSPQDLSQGTALIALGLYFKCCLADNFATLFDPSNTRNPFAIWITSLIFGLRIYYDFAGYSLVAVGVARCLGIRLTFNFNSPYASTSITEFWRRWHITLSQWFRDYIYLPLGGKEGGRWWFNLLVVFLVSGVWHGAGWNFVIWGALHGCMALAHRAVLKRIACPNWMAWGATMTGVLVAWLCFYETRSDALQTKLVTLFTPSAYSLQALRASIAERNPADWSVFAAMLTLTALTLLAEWRSTRVEGEPYSVLRHPRVLCLLVVLTVILSPGKNNGFLYFAF